MFTITHFGRTKRLTFCRWGFCIVHYINQTDWLTDWLASWLTDWLRKRAIMFEYWTSLHHVKEDLSTQHELPDEDPEEVEVIGWIWSHMDRDEKEMARIFTCCHFTWQKLLISAWQTLCISSHRIIIADTAAAHLDVLLHNLYMITELFLS